MALPKFLTFYKSLDSKQVFQFKKFALTHVGQEADAYRVLDYFSESDDWKKKYPGNEEMVERCLPGVNQKTFLNYLSMLYDIAQEWMALDQLRKEPYEQDLLVQRWLNRKGLHQQAEQVRTKVLRNLDNEQGVDYKLEKYRSEVHFEYLFCNNPDMNDYREEDYRAMLQSFDAYFCGKSAMMMSEVFTFGKYFHVDMTKDLDHMTSKMNKKEKHKMVVHSLQAFKMISKPETRNWVKLCDIILNDEIRVGSLMHSVFTRYALKTGIHLWSSGKHKDIDRIAEIAKYALRTGVYLDEGKMSPTSFHNLVVTMCQVYTEKEMEKFAKDWSAQVDVRYRRAAASIANAQISFYFGHYNVIADHTTVMEMSSNQRYIAQGLDLIAAFENRVINPDKYQRQSQKFGHYLMYNKDVLSSDALLKYKNLLKLLRDVDQNKEELFIEHYSPIYYRKYALELIKNKNSRLV
ncbi:MAG: hypothetical protein IPH94_00110 [Saprospiraceae bacterium]|nr:hypothetical protein [Saprospiraceae bacterium]